MKCLSVFVYKCYASCYVQPNIFSRVTICKCSAFLRGPADRSSRISLYESRAPRRGPCETYQHFLKFCITSCPAVTCLHLSACSNVLHCVVVQLICVFSCQHVWMFCITSWFSWYVSLSISMFQCFALHRGPADTCLHLSAFLNILHYVVVQLIVVFLVCIFECSALRRGSADTCLHLSACLNVLHYAVSSWYMFLASHKSQASLHLSTSLINCAQDCPWGFWCPLPYGDNGAESVLVFVRVCMETRYWWEYPNIRETSQHCCFLFESSTEWP
jgi:hypothetical protein